MSYASYHQQKNLVLPNIFLVFRNVTFPSAVAWNKLNDDGICWYGKRMRFYDSSGRATNLLLLNDSNVYYNYYYYDSTYTQSVDPTAAVVISLIFLVILWPGIPLLIRFFFNRMGKLFFLSLPLFWIYGLFGMVEKQLLLAARYGHLPSVIACLKRGVDINCSDNKDCERGLLQFLNLILYFGPFWVPFFCLLRCCQIRDAHFETVLDAEGQVDDTPLILAVRNRHLPVVTYLIQQNANVKIQNVCFFSMSLRFPR